MGLKKIRVLIIDDSLLFREVLAQSLMQDEGLEVIGTAPDANSAYTMVKELRPDVVTLDIEMPGVNGIDLLKELLHSYPVPVVMVSSLNGRIFEALSAGAVDFVAKPINGNMGMKGFVNELAVKIKIASSSKVGLLKNKNFQVNRINSNPQKTRLIAIGASTGGTEAILKVLHDLPIDIPGIVVVQHIPPIFSRMFAERMNNICRIRVKEAVDGDPVSRGLALVAPGDAHLTVLKGENGLYVRCRKGQKVSGHCPSVDVMFESVSKSVGSDAIGVILTGMGADGSKGLLNMKKAGAYTIGQDENTSAVYGMPMEAYKLGAVAKQLPLSSIADEIIRNI